MSEFIGRTGSKRLYSYPEPRRTGEVGPFARNFAIGPGTATDVTSSGTQVPWSDIQSGADPGVDVPITPKSTGRFLLTGVISVKNVSSDPVEVLIQIQLDGITLPLPGNEQTTVTGQGAESIPFVMMNSLSGSLAPGVTRNFEILVTADSDEAILLVAESSSFNIQEVPASSG